MPYIGNEVGNRFVASKAASVYSGNGSTTAFTLEHAVGSDEDILVSVDGVIQEPSVAYAVSSGTTLTFTAAPSSNSGNNIFVYYLFRTVATVDHPSTSALTATSGTFSTTLASTGNATVGGTLSVTGETTLATHLNLGDNDIIKVGAGSDIQIYHDGSYSRIMESGGTALVLDTTSTDIRLTASNSEVMGKFIKDGAVQLYYDNSQKLSTTSSGVTITGAIRVGADNAANELDDYEEGTYTISEPSGQASITNNRVHYTKIGRLVTVQASIAVSSNSNTNPLNLSLPFSSSINSHFLGGGNISYTNVSNDYASNNLRPNIENTASDVHFIYNANTTLTCANASNCRIDFAISYYTE